MAMKNPSLRQRLRTVLRQHTFEPCFHAPSRGPGAVWALCAGCGWESEHFIDHDMSTAKDAHTNHLVETLYAEVAVWLPERIQRMLS